MKLIRVTQEKHTQWNKLGIFYSNPASTCWYQSRSHRNSLDVTTRHLTQQLTWKPAMRKALPAWSKRISLCCSVQRRPHLLVRTATAAPAFLLSLRPGSKTQQAVSRISSFSWAFQLYNAIVFISWLILFGLNGLPVGHSFQGWTTTCKSKSHRASTKCTSYPAPNLYFPFDFHKAYTLTPTMANLVLRALSANSSHQF